MWPLPPCPAPTHWWWMQASGPLLCWQFWLGMYSVAFFFSSSQLCCPLRFLNSSQTRLNESFLLCWNFSSFMTPSPGWISIPKYFVSVFVFYILSYLLLKRLCCISGGLVSFASSQKLFCWSFPTFKWLFDKIVGEKVVSLSYSSAILGNIFCFICLFIYFSFHHFQYILSPPQSPQMLNPETYQLQEQDIL